MKMLTDKWNNRKTRRNYPAGQTSKSIKFAIEYGLAVRLLSVLLITGLLIPLVFFGQTSRTSVQNSPFKNQTPANASAPAEPFVGSDSSSDFSSGSLTNITESSFAAVSQSLANGYQTVADSLTTPTPPEGFAMAKASTLWDRASDGVSSIVSPFLGTPVSAAPAPGVGKFDFDGDNKADAARWQSSTGEWKVRNSSNGSISTITQTASSTSVIAPADYNGDGKTDYAVLNYSTGTWTIKHNALGTTQTITGLGQAGDKVVSGKYESGDSSADAAVYRPSNGTWYVKQSSTGTIVSTAFGASTDIPAPGDYDGDGLLDYAVFRPSSNGFYVKHSLTGGVVFFQWGVGTDTPVPADYDGDGKTDFAVYRSSTGTWYVNRSNGYPYIGKTWGNYGDQPVPADYDNDGKDDFAVWRPTTGVWHIVKSSDQTFNTYDYYQLGVAGDTAVPSAYLKQIGGQVLAYNLANARLAPKNATGGTDLYSRNFSWGTSLVNLPGRAGLDAGFGMSYNSLVWTKEPTSNTMVFDADQSNVSPGFRFGFPVIEPNYYNALTQKFSYLMVTPSGERVEFRQDAASGVYETADSSYAQLTVNVPLGSGGHGQPPPPTENLTLTVKTTDGTQMEYSWKAGAYRLNQIKDRNGNFITVVYDSDYGLLRSVTDTMGRVITVQYDSEFYPITVKQDWKLSNGNGAVTPHTYATFTYGYAPMSPNFSAGISVFGPTGGMNIKVLSQITYADGSSTTFNYNSYGQVYKVRNVAADSSAHVLNSMRTDLQTPATVESDCPRFSKTYNYTENFNDVNGQPAETLVHNDFAANQTFTGGGGAVGAADVVEVRIEGAPHNTKSKIWYHTAGNWSEGLPFGTEDIADSERKRWTRTVWTQDDPTKVYIVNPRVTESRVGDETNTKKTTVNYHLQAGSTTASRFGLAKEVRVYDTNQTTVLKKSVTDYNFGQAYLDRRIIGLPLESRLYEGENLLQSKMTYNYDEGDFSETEQGIPSVIQHDTTNYSSSFIIGRGNVASVTRCDALLSLNAECGGGSTSRVKYNLAGAAVAQITPGSTPATTREVKISYADKFNDTTTSRNTYAYPTKITDPAGNFSKVEYRYDIGANVYAESPVPAGQAQGTAGKITKRFFDTIGRLEKESLFKNGADYAYTKYEYPPSQNVTVMKTTLTDTNNNGVGDATDEVISESYLDGAGRVYKTRSPMSFGGSGTVATWTGQKVEYDLLGRVKRQTVPTEMDANWNATNTDQSRGWQWTSQEYDWKGRVTRQIGLDNVDRVYEYEGCGCAGGQVTTVKSELVDGERRTQKMYADILGRTWKTEILDYNDAVYTSTVTKYNGRDQAVWTKQFAGVAPSNALDTDSCPVQPTGEAQSCQIATSEYDGHGRLTKSHAPQQDTNKFTTYAYNAADQPETVTDARGAVSTYSYNNRGLVETIQQAMPINQPPMSFATCAPGDANCFGDGMNVATSSPVGYLDYADSTARVIAGWSVDKDAPSVSNEVHFYIDGPAGTGTGIGTAIADKERLDVSQYYPGNHGYEFVVPEQYADGKPHLIYVYGIDVTGNNPPVLLTNSPKSILLNPATKTTTFEYDNLGNRTKMTDETGVTDYEYDALSRVRAEKKHLRNSWNLTRHDYDILYDYNLTGQLKSVTDPFGDKIDYGVDKGGKLEEISGTPFSSTDGSGTAQVTDYINDIEYRAWGAVKSIDYGNTVKMSQIFDSRLRVGEFNVSKTGQTASLIKKSYQYYNDNRLKFSDDTGDTFFRTDSHRFDRSYSYDFMGRLTAAKTGAEARGETTNIDRNKMPYKRDYAFNAFGNVTSRQGYTWTEADNQTNAWTNNRESTWTYDADGRLKHTPENNYDYDAAGAVIAVALDSSRVSYQMTDGEGRTVRRDFYDILSANGLNTFDKTEYAIYSSVLGKLLTEVKSDGTKKRTFVYGAGGVVATQNKQGATLQHVAWRYEDPSNASFISTTHSGAPLYYGDGGQAELDPLGSNVGLSNPYDENNPPNLAAGPGSYGTWGDPFGSYTCMVDWMIGPCSQAAQVLSSGAGNLGPLEQFRRVTNRNTGETAWGQFRNYGNNMTGWWADFFSGPTYSGETIKVGIETHSIRYNNSALWQSEYSSAIHSILNEQNSDENQIGSTYDTITPKKGQENHEGRCRALKNSIESHSREAQRHLDHYGKDFSTWKHERGNYLTGQLRDYQKHVDLVRQETQEYMMFCSDQGPPPPVPVFVNVPQDIRDAGKKPILQRVWESLPSIPPFPNDKQIEEFYKQYPPILIPMPGRRMPRFPLRF